MLKERTKKLHKGRVAKIERVSCSSHFIEFEAESGIISSPGQFVSILCNNLTLRRPFSIASQSENRIGVLFKERGEGTEYIKSLKKGDLIDFVGPLGNGFNISNKKSLLVGAGIGIAPIFYLQNTLTSLHIESLLIGGFFSNDEIPSNIKCDITCTNDGSLGEKGSVIDYLEDVIDEYSPEIIYSCGPKIVLENVAKIAQKHSIESQVAIEKVMACGIGVCKGCAIKVIKNGEVQNATVCKDGPVFNGGEVVWQ